MRARLAFWATLTGVAGLALGMSAWGGEPESESMTPAERGRIALTTKSHLKPAWGNEAYRKAGALWEGGAPRSRPGPRGLRRRLPQALRPAPGALSRTTACPWASRGVKGPDGSKTGIQLDCMVCHGGSIGGTSYVGLGNTPARLARPLPRDDPRRAAKWLPPSPFVVNSSRGTVNAGMFAAVLLSYRNSDLSIRKFPLPLGANIPELDVPAWWLLGKKTTMYYDGRIDARSVRSNMSSCSARRRWTVEGAGADLQRHPRLLGQPQAPQVSLPDRPDQGRPGPGGFREDVLQVPRHLRAGRQISQHDRRAEGDRHRPRAGPGTLRPDGHALQLDLVGRE